MLLCDWDRSYCSSSSSLSVSNLSSISSSSLFFFVLEYSRRRLHRLLCRRVRYRGATSLERTPHHLLGNIAPSLVYPSKERGVWERDCTMTDGVNKFVT